MKKVNLFLNLAFVLSVISCQQENKTEKNTTENSERIRVQTAVVQVSDSIKQFNYSGIITPAVSTKLSFQLPGSVAKIYVEEGDKVQKGQVLAELDNTSYRSTYKAAQAMQEQARDAYTRLKTVYEKGSLPEIQWEEIKSKLEQANSAEAIAGKNLDNCKITAPSNGIIGSCDIETGSSVMPGITVIDLVDINEVFVRISVPENEINKLIKGQKAFIVIPAISQNKIEGKVEKIGVLANLISKTYEVKIRIKNPDLKIKPGMVCDVNLNIKKEENIITIPSQAVIKDSDNKNYVFLIDRKSKEAKKQEVMVGEFSNNNLNILSGLKEGDLIVINGQHKLSTNSYVVY